MFHAVAFSLGLIVSVAVFLAADAAAAPVPQSSSTSAGEKLVKSNDCISCHAVNRKLVGPAYMDVAKRYRGKPGAAAKLMAKVRTGGSGNWGQVPMTPHPALTNAQLKSMIDWILSLGAKPAQAAGPAAAPAKLFSYTLPDGSSASLDVQLFVPGSEKDQKVTKDIFHGYE